MFENCFTFDNIPNRSRTAVSSSFLTNCNALIRNGVSDRLARAEIDPAHSLKIAQTVHPAASAAASVLIAPLCPCPAKM